MFESFQLIRGFSFAPFAPAVSACRTILVPWRFIRTTIMVQRGNYSFFHSFDRINIFSDSQAIIESEFLNDGFRQAILAAELLCFLFMPLRSALYLLKYFKLASETLWAYSWIYLRLIYGKIFFFDFLDPIKQAPALKGRRFTAIDDIKSASLKELKAIPKIEFEKCFEDWKKRWHKCIISNIMHLNIMTILKATTLM